MIIKFKNKQAWGSYDQLASEMHYSESMQKMLDNVDPEFIKKESEKYGTQTAMYNAIFLNCKGFKEVIEDGASYHTVYLIDDEQLPTIDSDFDLTTVVCAYRKPLDYDFVVFITNQELYKENDEGRTIDRLS